MKKRVSKNSISLARTLGVAGLLAVALVMTPGCSQADDHQTAVQVANSDNAQEEDAVYGKMEYSIAGVEVHDSSTGDGGKVSVVRWHAINNRTADSFATGSYITAYQNKQMLHGGLAADLQEDSFSSQGRREANATVCRFSNSMTCPPLKLRSTARALDRTLSTRPLNWNRPHT